MVPDWASKLQRLAPALRISTTFGPSPERTAPAWAKFRGAALRRTRNVAAGLRLAQAVAFAAGLRSLRGTGRAVDPKPRAIRRRLMAGQRILVPLIGVRISAPELPRLEFRPRAPKLGARIERREKPCGGRCGRGGKSREGEGSRPGAPYAARGRGLLFKTIAARTSGM